jgi:hypothetical protein
LRLGHISLFGIGLINLGFVLTAHALGIRDKVNTSSMLFLIGVVGMPLLCYLSAIKDTFRHLFFIPVLAVVVGIATFLYQIYVL